MKRPAFQFYPSDWRTDPGLRLCSLPARGLWIEMLCLMHEGEPYGHLTASSVALDAAKLARLIGENSNNVKKWLKELDDGKVFSRNDSGVIYSRRMLRDESIREARAAGGAQGGSFGHLGGKHGTKGGRPPKSETPLNDEPKGGLKPSPSSSSSSPSPSKEEPIANAMDGEPSQDANPTDDPIDLKALLFSTGKPYLTRNGVSLSNAGSILGKWRQSYGDGAVIDALALAQAEACSDPIPFITKLLEKRNGNATRLAATGVHQPQYRRDPAWEGLKRLHAELD
jgi:hypothetical protein